MDFLKQVSIEIYPEGASDEERKSYSKKYGAQMHALLDAIRRQRQEREFSQQRNGSGKECFEEKSVRDSMMSGYESGQGKLWIVDNGKRAQELLEQGCPVLVWLHEDNRDQDFSGVRYACENISELDFDYLEKVYRRYVDIPWEILTTKRCLVRETCVEDLDALYEIYADPSVTKYTEGLYPERAKEEAYLKDYTENMYYFYNYGVWTICDRMTGQVIGRAGFSNREGCEDPELGFVIGVPWQRQGYATEVCKALLEYGKEELGFEQVQMLVMPENEISLHLAERLGFSQLDQVTWEGTCYERLLMEL